MAFFMETKTCCCGCDLKTGTWILVILIAIINGLFFYNSISSTSPKPSYDIFSNSYSRQSNFGPQYHGSGTSLFAVTIELLIFACCASAGFSMKKDKRMFLIPFMVIIIGIFVCMLLLSIVVLLAVAGISSAMNSLVEANSFQSVLGNMGNDQQSKQNFSAPSFSTFMILSFIICVANIAIFLHFVKVVCSLFAEMGKPNGMILPPTSPSMNCSYYPNIS